MSILTADSYGCSDVDMGKMILWFAGHYLFLASKPALLTVGGAS
ncbi:hypothetical protein [Aquisediminimonas sediminicola]|nr:hypothetical protein [Aquisediminimonas sediminicola]